MSQTITLDALKRLAGEWIAQGKRAIGPVRVKDDFIQYASLTDADALMLSGFVHPANSIKEFLFPRTEPIYTYRFKGQAVELGDCEPNAGEQAIIGARPCDAASVAILDHVFNWDYKDDFYNTRRAATTIIALGCTDFDDECFCTSVGLGPVAEKGADALLIPMDGGFEVRCLTPKGEAFFAGKTQTSDKSAPVPAGPEVKFDVAEIRARLADNYEDPAWREIVLRCLGCGACAYVCPTCHCFDIVDEGTAVGGARIKNWDSCQFGMFTMHASGHNPRATQGQRQRQRIQHKFRIYPEKFNEVLCTGCGNCTRNCPVGLGVLNTIGQLRAFVPPVEG